MLKNTIKFIQETYKTSEFIPLHEPVFLGNEKKYVNDCIDSTFVSSVGKYVDNFESLMESFTGSAKAVATMNGTASLSAALYAAGVKRDDLVIYESTVYPGCTDEICIPILEKNSHLKINDDFYCG